MKKGLMIKFGELQHLIELRDKGHLYCNPLSYFTKIESSKAYDPFETITEYHFMGEGTIQLWPVDSTFEKDGKIMQAENVELKTNLDSVGNVYCLYFLDQDSIIEAYGPHHIHDRNSREGDYLLIIHQVDEFFERLNNVKCPKNISISRGQVQYVDMKSLKGKKNVFQKPLEYRDECEYRLYLAPGSPNPISLYIGSIADISTIYHGKLNEVHIEPESEDLLSFDNIDGVITHIVISNEPESR